MNLETKFKSFFKKKRTPDFPSGEKNPYVNAQRAWNTYVGGVLAQKTMWQLVALSSSAITAICVCGVIYLGSQSKFVPYLVALPQTTNIPIAVSPADVSKINDKIIQATLNEWIYSARLVTPDVSVERKAIFTVFAHLAPESSSVTKMTEEMSGDNDRFKLASTITRDIQVTDILPQSPETWEIDWVETVRNRTDGTLIGKPYKMRALVHVSLIPPDKSTSEDRLRQNPLGLYIPDFSWSKQL